LITLVSLVKSEERWTNSLIDNAAINIEVRERWINISIDNAGINIEVRGKLDKQSY